MAGDDHDPRGSVRQFRTISQGVKYDAGAELITRWLPELRELPIEARHQPWSLDNSGGLGYPKSLLDPSTQLTKADQNKGTQ